MVKTIRSSPDFISTGPADKGAVGTSKVCSATFRTSPTRLVTAGAQLKMTRLEIACQMQELALTLEAQTARALIARL